MFKFHLLTLSFAVAFLQCAKHDPVTHFIFLHNFEATVSQELFSNGLQEAADSMRVTISLLDQASSVPQKILDSLFKQADGISYSTPIRNDIYLDFIHRARKKELPMNQFHARETKLDVLSVIDSDSYTAGQTAARFILQQFGKNGRFGILTPTLENQDSNESIRGFREELATSKSTWKQINIITCNDRREQAINQYRHACRFGNRMIWFFASNCSDFIDELKNLKKDNFFIAIDLHPNENNLKLLLDGSLDAVVTTDFKKMGELCLFELVRQREDVVEFDQVVLNCGSLVLTPALLQEQAQKEVHNNLRGEVISHEIMEKDF